MGLKAQQSGTLSPKHHLHPDPIEQEMENFCSDETAKGLRASDWEGTGQLGNKRTDGHIPGVSPSDWRLQICYRLSCVLPNS